MENKTCTKCQSNLPIEEFAVRDKNTGRRHSWCSQCLKKYKAEKWHSNKDAMKQYKKDWYKKNKEDQKAKCRQRYHSGDKIKHAEVVWKNKLIREFGITREQYQVLLESQGGVCKICNNKDDRRLAVDHCHKSGHVRGLLCRRCNTSIGLLGDSPELIRKAADYIENSTKDVDQKLVVSSDFPQASVS